MSVPPKNQLVQLYLLGSNIWFYWLKYLVLLFEAFKGIQWRFLIISFFLWGKHTFLEKKTSKNVSWQVNRERVSEIWIQRIRSKVSKSWTNNRTLAAWSSCWWHIEYFSVKMCILPIYIYKLQLIPSNIKVQKFLCNSI